MTKSKHVLEKEIEARLRRGVQALGGVAYKWVSPGNSGVPDRVVILPGAQVYFVELKTETGKLSPVQERQHARLRRCGFSPITLYGMEAVEEFLAKCQTMIPEVTE